jgi:hypothetical protein
MSFESVCMVVEEAVEDEVLSLSLEHAAREPMVRRARQQRMRFFIGDQFFAKLMPSQGKKFDYL